MKRSLRTAPLIALIAVVALAALATSAGYAGTGASKRVVKLEEAAGGATVLANLEGRTLYSLSVETHGRFVCTGGCLSVWHPLTVPKGVRPKGPVKLGTVKRPDGRIQVTYRGRPLYSFAEDTKSGETNGDGIRDVGTWHPAAAPAAPRGGSPSQSAPPEAPNPYSPY